ncbi:MAG: hypothetical protein ACI4S4_04130 [Candidatus Ornithospirochaeta sp.]
MRASAVVFFSFRRVFWFSSSHFFPLPRVLQAGLHAAVHVVEIVNFDPGQCGQRACIALLVVE